MRGTPDVAVTKPLSEADAGVIAAVQNGRASSTDDLVEVIERLSRELKPPGGSESLLHPRYRPAYAKAEPPTEGEIELRKQPFQVKYSRTTQDGRREEATEPLVVERIVSRKGETGKGARYEVKWRERPISRNSDLSREALLRRGFRSSIQNLDRR
ncbi:unnamed protein product, partial [marine sediment metagenome]